MQAVEKLEKQAGETVSKMFILAGSALGAALLAGLLAALYYTSHFAVLSNLKISFQSLRPLHVGGAVTWIYLACLAVVLDFLFAHSADQARQGKSHLDAATIARHVKLLLWLWVPAGLVAMVSMLMGVFSGREYLGFHPGISLFVILGWLVFARLFFRVYGFSLKKAPVYIWMWVTGIFLFIYSFTEAHAYLIEQVSLHPVRDLAVQWKSYGTLVGSFNLFVYGSLLYLGERAGNKAYAYSKMAFALFFLGILNSFTNFGHHTYHIPQSSWVKWIAFSVSMTEILVLAKVMIDLVMVKGVLKQHQQQRPLVAWVLCAVTCWTFLQLVMALLISVPPINALFHGTHLILAHSMGSMIGIDTMALLALSAYLFRRHHGDEAAARACFAGKVAVVGLNLGLLILWGALSAIGIRSAARLYFEGILARASGFPEWMGSVLMISGLLMTVSLVTLLFPWFVQRKRATAPMEVPSCGQASAERAAG